MVEISLSPALDNKLQELVHILWENDYFGFVESAENYVNRIYDFISKINKKPKYKCKNQKYGRYYAMFKMNSNTTFYIVFENFGDKYLVNTIFNNHEIGYKLYI
ncbi:hypothetical protein EGI22_07570 [Lacihabitans sp. LS3-19]|uniref:hypothetical protein n=1 Tax=Lacihabitans sp. LS3-19 TaxID=2487335 RepID=UPI0020CD1DF7|nr:hypothetical protein [Lacihabitans sp. LS3-19]MCP9767768.1 hypothetical protein [Lacihabitans sp. LS3-19]